MDSIINIASSYLGRRETPVVIPRLDEINYDIEDRDDALLLRLEELRNISAPFSYFRSEYEKCYNCNLIMLPDTPSSGSIFSLTSPSSLTNSVTEKFLIDLRGSSKEIHLILNTTGGPISCAEKIVSAILKSGRHLKVFIRNSAMSAGTIIALCADELYIQEYSSMGRVDPQVGFFYSMPMVNTQQMVTTLEMPFFRDIFRIYEHIGGCSGTRVEDMIDRISQKKGWSDEMRTNIKSKLLFSGGDHDEPLMYEAINQFWDHESIPFFDGWTETMKLMY